MSTDAEWDQELVFHDTVPLPTEQLELHRKKAVRQKDIVLSVFRLFPGRNFTPSEIRSILEGGMLLTSVRRCITDLTKEGRLIKCQYSESRNGAYDTLNRTWRYNTEYVKPISLPKDYISMKNINYQP